MLFYALCGAGAIFFLALCATFTKCDTAGILKDWRSLVPYLFLYVAKDDHGTIA